MRLLHFKSTVTNLKNWHDNNFSTKCKFWVWAMDKYSYQSLSLYTPFSLLGHDCHHQLLVPVFHSASNYVVPLLPHYYTTATTRNEPHCQLSLSSAVIKPFDYVHSTLDLASALAVAYHVAICKRQFLLPA